VPWNFDESLGSIQRGAGLAANAKGPIVGASGLKSIYLTSCDPTTNLSPFEDTTGKCKNWEEQVSQWLSEDEQRSAAYASGVYNYPFAAASAEAELLRGCEAARECQASFGSPPPPPGAGALEDLSWIESAGLTL
jgi:hypothetical protein